MKINVLNKDLNIMHMYVYMYNICIYNNHEIDQLVSLL